MSLHVIARSHTRPPVCLYVRSPVAPPVRASTSLSAHRPSVRLPVHRPVRSPVLVRPPCFRRSFLPTVFTFFRPSDRGLSPRSFVSLSDSTSARPYFRKTAQCAHPSVRSSAHHPSLYIRLLTGLASFLPIRPCVGPSVLSDSLTILPAIGPYFRPSVCPSVRRPSTVRPCVHLLSIARPTILPSII